MGEAGDLIYNIQAKFCHGMFKDKKREKKTNETKKTSEKF